MANLLRDKELQNALKRNEQGPSEFWSDGTIYVKQAGVKWMLMMLMKVQRIGDGVLRITAENLQRAKPTPDQVKAAFIFKFKVHYDQFLLNAKHTASEEYYIEREDATPVEIDITHMTSD